jgi:hypothetical protein
VYVGANTWLELEPTPGYELLAAEPTWFEWLGRGVRRGLEVLWRHPVATLAWVGGLVGLWWWRRTLLDVLGVAVWRAWRARDPRARVLQTLGLLDRRRRWFGPPAVAGSTLRRRLRPLHTGDPGTERVLEEFLRWADWAAYGGRVAPPAEPGGVEALCRRVQSVLGRGTWIPPRPETRQQTGI